MESRKIIHAPVILNELQSLRCGELVYLTGSILTGRDAAHKRLSDLLLCGKPLPIELENQIIYYTGPCPTPPGHIIGSCGPTTGSRMDSYTPALLDLGLKGMIGKGPRSVKVIESIEKNQAVYFAAVGGAGALLARCVEKAKVIAFDDLGPEAIYHLQVKNFPLIVAVDSTGDSLYKLK